MKEPAMTITLDEDANCVWVEATGERRESLTIEAAKCGLSVEAMLQADCEAAAGEKLPPVRLRWSL